MVSGTFTTALDSSAVNTVLPTITTSLHTDISIVQWVPTVYLLTISCFLLLNGRLGDIAGHKKVFLYGLAAFTLTSVICGASHNIWMLIICRVLQGIGASMVMAVGVAITIASFPETERGKAIGVYATGSTIALALGPTLGGLIAEHLSWRYIFYINAPIGTAALIYGSRIIPRSITRPDQRLDFPGALAAIVFLPTLILYFNKGEEWGWTSPTLLALLAVAIVFGALFVYIERVSKQPLLSLTLFRDRVFSFASLTHLFCYMAYMGIIFLTPFYMKFVLDYSIFKVGLVMAAFPVVIFSLSPLTGAASDRVGTRVFVIGGISIIAVGLLLLSGLDESSTTFDIVWRLAIAGLGVSGFVSPNISTIMGSVPKQYLGVASGMYSAMRNVGMAFGIAIAGAILYGLAPVSASTDPGAFSSSDIDEFMRGLQWAYVSGAALAGTAILFSILAIRRHPQA